MTIMGKFSSKNVKLTAFTLFLCAVFLSFNSMPSYAQEGCTINNPFPPSEPPPISEAGDRRVNSKKGKVYKHTGSDFFYPSGQQKIVIPQNCTIQENQSGNIVWEQNSKKSNGEPAGYGYYMVLNCGNYGGDTVQMMLAHLPKNPYNAATKEIMMGTSGNVGDTTPHYHVEMVIGDRRVDPQCILGIEKSNLNADDASEECKRCPNIGPANLCSPEVRNSLIGHGGDCFGSNAGKVFAGGSTVDPDRIRNSGITSSPDNSPPDTSGSDGGDINDPTGGVGSTPTPELDPIDDTIPEVPPPPPVPGQPEGVPELVLTPDESPEKLTGCAADTWTAMVNQAVMQTRREDLLNKRFIVKPDSVLDYSCYTQKVKAVADSAGPIFSETTRWDNVSVDLIGKNVNIQLKVLEEDYEPFLAEKGLKFEIEYEQSNGTSVTYDQFDSLSLDMAIDRVVGYVAKGYFPGNFPHGFLSDTAPVSGASAENCNIMNAVWQAAKCKNFDDVDVFYTFDDLVGIDPREFPVSMPCL